MTTHNAINARIASMGRKGSNDSKAFSCLKTPINQPRVADQLRREIEKQGESE